MEPNNKKHPTSSGTCPLCNKKLELKQINFKQAVFICPDIQCPYPVGDFQCILVQRPLKHIKQSVEFPINLINSNEETETENKINKDEEIVQLLMTDIEKILDVNSDEQNVSITENSNESELQLLDSIKDIEITETNAENNENGFDVDKFLDNFFD